MNGETPKTILLERIVAAPRARVYKAFLDPEDLLRWHYATEGWTTPYARVDARVGGEFHIGFKSLDGKSDFDFAGTFDELIEPERIVYTIADGRKVWVAFADEGGKTRVSLTLTLETANSEELQRQGWGEMLVHLGNLLAKA